MDAKQRKVLAHGGDWAGFEIEYGRAPLDFSMNVNPLGIPAEVQAAIAKAAQTAERYPDPLCRQLVQKLAEHEDVPQEWIFCGNGAADIIFRLAQALRLRQRVAVGSEVLGAGSRQDAVTAFEHGFARATKKPTLLITAPTFSEYETAFAEYGWEVRRYLLKEEAGFRIGGATLDEQTTTDLPSIRKSSFQEECGSSASDGIDDFLCAITEDVDAVFLCEPNNPTGVTTDRQGLQLILEKCRQTGTMLIIDECFNGFLEDPADHSMKGELAAGSLIILKAFTKLYGMAGVRLGYCLCADEEVIDSIRAAGPPWNVSGLAQMAGIAALDAAEHVAQGLQIVHEERPWLKEQLRRLGIDRIYGEANYILFYYAEETPTADEMLGIDELTTPALDTRLRKHGILIRNCSNYAGLGDGWYRIAARTHEENQQFIDAMRETLHRE